VLLGEHNLCAVLAQEAGGSEPGQPTADDQDVGVPVR
jgi:hypothetical protein